MTYKPRHKIPAAKGSLAGNLTLSAGKDVSVRGSDLVAQQDINLVGRNIDMMV